MRRSLRWSALVLVIAALLLTACGGSSSSSSPAPAPSAGGSSSPAPAPAAKKDLGSASLIVNWFPQPEHGGEFAALKLGYFAEKGVNMTIKPGGPGIAAIPLVASGNVDFGLVIGEDLITARSKGIPVVAIAAPFQHSLRVVIAHDDVKKFEDLNGKKVYTIPGDAWWLYLEKKYNLKVTQLAYNGQLATFFSDPNAATQGYLTSEPKVAELQNQKVTTLKVSDAGYDPYSNVLFTTEKTIKEKPDLVRAVVEASVKGWTDYFAHEQEVNDYLKSLNKDLDPRLMDYAVQTFKPLVLGDDAASHGVGYMSQERWATVAKQLKDIGVIQQDVDVSKVFTNDFLPKK